jgi:hypothetical protein
LGSLARRGGGSHLEPYVTERIARLAQRRVVLGECGVVEAGRGVPCSTVIPAARKLRAEIHADAIRTGVLRVSSCMVQVIVMGLSCSARLLVRNCETDSWEKGWQRLRRRVRNSMAALRYAPYPTETSGRPAQKLLSFARAIREPEVEAAHLSLSDVNSRTLRLEQMRSVRAQLPVKAEFFWCSAAGRPGSQALAELALERCVLSATEYA